MQNLKDKQIVVAGGTGGLGTAVVELLRAEGARVIASGKTRGDVPADITSEADRLRLLDSAPNLYGLVVLTGIPARSPAELETSLAVNFSGPVALARLAADRMKAAGTPGAIVVVSTMQAAALFSGSTTYAAPKAALLHAARILAKETRGPANIRVNVICPGVNDAGMAQASIKSGKYERYLTEHMIPRYGRAPDVARAVRFFLEPDNYTTGQVLTVDGGLTL
jgi:NAD(P)-dependent dehydrogenase (short-subunit alcohol dehydrogenase family)